MVSASIIVDSFLLREGFQALDKDVDGIFGYVDGSAWVEAGVRETNTYKTADTWMQVADSLWKKAIRCCYSVEISTTYPAAHSQVAICIVP